jgi:hypothetical protein
MTVLAIIILIVLAYVIYRLDKLWTTMRWILEHVHVVSKADSKDPDMLRIKSIFGIPEEGKD